jgi:hypothetical protein
MAVLSKSELMEKLKGVIGDKSDDETLAFIEDVNDTLDEKKTDDTDWQKKYEENDKEWREKYKKRFFEQSGNEGTDEGNEGTDEGNEETEEKTIEKFEDLFTTKEE